ncbi:hypothetical protein NQD34_018166 [Periophthalmus magnuspinnatus]|nr:hypothetical protein NQD34_018166 [Periophthalmus magnuspinnatus]
MTERTRSRMQVAEISFLRRVAGRSLRDRVRTSVTREELEIEPLPSEVAWVWPGNASGSSLKSWRCGEGSLGLPAETAASVTRPQIKQKKKDGGPDKMYIKKFFFSLTQCEGGVSGSLWMVLWFRWLV